MNNILKEIVCKTSCGDENGTGFLISHNAIMTARHCILENIGASQHIYVFFEDNQQKFLAELIFENKELDIAVLSFKEHHNIQSKQLLSLSNEKIRENEDWQTFGFISVDEVGKNLHGSIERHLSKPDAIIDIHLSIDNHCEVPDYAGMSGSPIVVNRSIVGVVREQIDNSLGGA